MSLRLAVVQPLAHPPPEDERNVAEAVRHVEAAAAQGAEFVVFPESYPGPWRMPAAFDPTDALVEAAERCGVYVQFGTLEPIGDSPREAHNLVLLARPGGGPPGKYRRTHPPGPGSTPAAVTGTSTTSPAMSTPSSRPSAARWDWPCVARCTCPR